MSNPRVLHAFKDYFPPTRGGVEQHINDLVHSLKGHQFAVLTSSRSRRKVVEDDDGVRVIRSPELARPVSTPFTPSWSKFLRESGADLLHFHMPNPFGELALLASRTPSPMIASYHSDIVGRGALTPLFSPFQQRFLKKAKAVIVGSSRLVDTSLTLQPIREKCVVVPYGVDVGDWATPPQMTEAIKEQYPGPLVVFLGRIAWYKGVEVLVEAMRGVEATCMIVGDGPLATSVRKRVAELGFRHKVVFIGDVRDDQRSAYLHAADVFVLPATSRAETFGIAMLQAMACGTPAISTEVGTGTSWVNKHLETGLVVAPNDPNGLAGAIKALLADTPKRLAMGFAASERASTTFTRFTMLESIASLYASV